MGYDGVYRYNLCMRYRGWLPNSTPVEGRGKTPMGFNMFQPSKGGAGFRKNPQLSTVHFSKQWLSGFSTQQWLLYILYVILHWHAVFSGITPLIPSGKRVHNYGKSACFSWENPLFRLGHLGITPY